MGVLRRLRHWLAVTLPQSISDWLLHSYRRPVGLFVGVVLVPFALITAVTYHRSVQLWRQQTMDNLRVMARLGSEILGETLDETLLLEQLVAAQPAFAEAVARGDAPAVQQALQDAFHFIRRINAVQVVSVEGRVLAAAPEAGLAGADISQRESYRAPQQQGWQPFISGVYLREGPEIEKVISVSWPIRRGDQVVGLLQVEQRIEEIKAWLQKIRVTPGGFLYVVDQHDQLVVFPFQLIPGKPLNVSNWPPVAATARDTGATLMYRSAKTGDTWLAGLYPVGHIGWRVVTTQPEQAALRTLRAAFSVLAILVLIAISLIAFVGSRWLGMHAFSLQILQQNAKLLKQIQQRRFFGQGEPPIDTPESP